MTRVAPLLTMVAVVSVGGVLFAANTATVPGSNPASVSVALPAAPDDEDGNGNGGNGSGNGGGVDTPPGLERLALADLPVSGAPGAPDEPPAGDVPPPPPRDEPPAPPVPFVDPAAAPPFDGDAYVGDTADGPNRPMTVSVAIVDGEAVAYVCDDVGIEAWLSGPYQDGELALESKSGRSALTGSPTKGTVTIDGRKYPYSTEKTDPAEAAAKGRPDVAEAAERVESGS